MSGGSLNYRFRHLDELADEIENTYFEFPDIAPEEEEELLDEINETIIKLRELAQKAHDIEWWLSGDYGDRTFYNNLTGKKTYKS